MTDSQALDNASDSVFPTRVDGYETHDVRDGLVVYRADDDSVHHLNAMATLFYELADGRSLTDIARSFGTIFDLDAQEALAAANTANRELVALRLVA